MDGEKNYWSSRVNRRTALRGGVIGAAGLVGAALIGCGDDDDDAAAPAAAAKPAATAAAAKPAATAAAAKPAAVPAANKPGGTFKSFSEYDIDSFDNHSSPTYKTMVLNAYHYSRLVRYSVEADGSAATGQVEGDLAESIEQVDDTTIVFKLRKGVRWDERAPTSGREFDSSDVVASWDRHSESGAYRAVLSNKVKDVAPIVSMEATDASTVTMKLARPDALTLPIMAWYLSGLWILPKEAANGGFDPTKEVRGNGPFIMEKHTPSVEFIFKRNPNWAHGPDMPYFDGIDLPIIADAAQREAQFRAGNIHMNGPSSNAFPQIIKEAKGTELFLGPPVLHGSSIGYNFIPESGFNDIRVRQALSMTEDRDTMGQVFLGLDDYKEIGYELTPQWNTPMSAGFGPFYLDPKGGNFGPGVKNLEYNMAEATKLMAAAGYDSNNKFTFDVIWPGLRYGADWPTIMEYLQAQAAPANIELNLVPIDYVTEWILKTEKDANGLRTGGGYFRSYTQFEGPQNKSAVMMNPSGGRSSAGEWLATFYHSAGPNNQVGENFPELDAKINTARTITDFDAQVDAYHDIQRYMMENMVVQPFYPRAEGTGIKWKGFRGPGEWQAWGGSALGSGNHINELIPQWWLEDNLR
tara:strand:+ start:336 stop:2246 length:1911 start_codon:yes stop_codon:yes gene_type:complete